MLETFPITTILRNGITGAIFVLVMVVFPLFVFSFDKAKDFVNASSVAGLAMISIISGFLLDAMKVYRLF